MKSTIQGVAMLFGRRLFLQALRYAVYRELVSREGNAEFQDKEEWDQFVSGVLERMIEEEEDDGGMPESWLEDLEDREVIDSLVCNALEVVTARGQQGACE